MRDTCKFVFATFLLAGCNSGTLDEPLFSFKAPPQFDGPVSVPTGLNSTAHYFMRMRGEHVARIDIAPIYIATEHSDGNSLQLDSARCADAALTGHLGHDAILTRDLPSTISAGGVPGTVIYYTRLREGTTFSALMACLRNQKIAVTIAFQEPSAVEPTDSAAVLQAIQSMSFK